MWVGELTLYNKAYQYVPHRGWRHSSIETLNYCKAHGIGWSILGYGRGRFQSATNIHTPKEGVLLIVRESF